MTAAQIAIVVAVSLMLLTVTIAIMVRINRSELRIIERRRQEWIARGSNPDEAPNFYSGSSGGGGGG
jgi:hypothetical protein